MQDFKQAVEDEFMKKELLKFAEDLENQSSRAMLQPSNYVPNNVLNKESSSDLDLEALKSRREKVLSDCGILKTKLNISSSENSSMKDEQALAEEAQREMQDANEMIERLEREEQEREMREAEEELQRELAEVERIRLLSEEKVRI